MTHHPAGPASSTGRTDAGAPTPSSGGPPALIDRIVPGPGGRFDDTSEKAQAAIANLVGKPPGSWINRLLRGNEWLGHPAHPIAVVVPIGAWVIAGVYDIRHAVTRSPQDQHTADGALGIGIAAAVPAALTGVAQYLDTRDGARRETAMHAALNNAALQLFIGSWVLRRRRQRRWAKGVSAVALAITGVSGYLGGDLAYRHGVGVRTT